MISDLIVACSGFYIIFVVLICGFTILDKLTCFTDKTLDVMERDNSDNSSERDGGGDVPCNTGEPVKYENLCKKKPAYEADNNEQLKYSTSEWVLSSGEYHSRTV